MNVRERRVGWATKECRKRGAARNLMSTDAEIPQNSTKISFKIEMRTRCRATRTRSLPKSTNKTLDCTSAPVIGHWAEHLPNFVAGAELFEVAGTKR